MDKPIAWYDPTNDVVSTDKDSPLFTPLGQVWPLYLPRTWTGLTEEELYEIYDESDDGSSPCGVCGACSKCKIEVAIARAIEAKLKEKNT
jgi:hypothetical protein